MIDGVTYLINLTNMIRDESPTAVIINSPIQMIEQTSTDHHQPPR